MAKINTKPEKQKQRNNAATLDIALLTSWVVQGLKVKLKIFRISQQNQKNEPNRIAVLFNQWKQTRSQRPCSRTILSLLNSQNQFELDSG